jgi:predicted ArsR family transcriptional regulator
VDKTYKISDLEQIHLLSDPLKLRLLQAFAESAKTTKQVATELGESVTKLYRHIDALHGAGLLQVVEERQKRGTIERTFRAVAQRFEADHSLFSATAGDEGIEAAREMLRVSESEILNVLSGTQADDREQAIVMRIRGKATPEKIAELRTTLQHWLDSIPDCDQAPAEGAVEIGGLIAFYEID